MFDKQHFDTLINIFLCFFLSVALSSVTLIYAHEFTFLGLIITFLGSFPISYVIGDLVPVGDLGNNFAKTLKLKEHSLVFALVCTAIVAVIMITCVSFFCTLVVFGFKAIMIKTWINVYPYWMLVGYILLLILMPISIKFATFLTSEKE